MTCRHNDRQPNIKKYRQIGRHINGYQDGQKNFVEVKFNLIWARIFCNTFIAYALTMAKSNVVFRIAKISASVEEVL